MEVDPVEVVRTAWADLADSRRIAEIREISANVSTNRVYRVVLDDHGTVVCKVSSYGSYFLFAEDHDRLHRCAKFLSTDPDTQRWAPFLANVLEKNGRPFT